MRTCRYEARQIWSASSISHSLARASVHKASSRLLHREHYSAARIKAECQKRSRTFSMIQACVHAAISMLEMLWTRSVLLGYCRPTMLLTNDICTTRCMFWARKGHAWLGNLGVYLFR